MCLAGRGPLLAAPTAQAPALGCEVTTQGRMGKVALMWFGEPLMNFQVQDPCPMGGVLASHLRWHKRPGQGSGRNGDRHRARTTTGWPGDQRSKLAPSLLHYCASAEHSASDKINDPAHPSCTVLTAGGRITPGLGATVSRGDSRLNSCIIYHALTTHPLFFLLNSGTDLKPPTLPGQEGQDYTSLLRITNLGVGCPAILPAPEHTREGQ